MKNRIRFISHKGKKILLVDCYQLLGRRIGGTRRAGSGTGHRRASRLGAAAGGFHRLEGRSRRAWSDQAALVFDRPHLKRSAWVGTEKFPESFLRAPEVVFAAGFADVQDARGSLDWLVED